MKRSDTKGSLFQTWGIFLQSTGELLGTAKSRIGAVSRSRKWSTQPGYLYIDRIVVP